MVLQLSGARLCAFHMNDCKKKKKLCRQKMDKNPKRDLISETITSVYQLFVIKILDGFVITFLDMKRLHYPDTVKKKNAIFNGTILIFLIIHYFFHQRSSRICDI